MLTAGYQVIGGVRVEQLHATRLGHLPGLGALPGDAAPIGRVTSLDAWVDSHRVIRQLPRYRPARDDHGAGARRPVYGRG